MRSEEEIRELLERLRGVFEETWDELKEDFCLNCASEPSDDCVNKGHHIIQKSEVSTWIDALEWVLSGPKGE